MAFKTSAVVFYRSGACNVAAAESFSGYSDNGDDNSILWRTDGLFISECFGTKPDIQCKSHEKRSLCFGADGSYEDAVGDLYTCYLKGSGEYDNVPYCLIGFSLGSFLVRDLLIKHPGLVDGAIIMGTGDISSIELKLARMAVWNEGRHVDDNKTSPGIRKLTFGTYNKKFKPNRTDYDWLCADNKQLDEYIADVHRGEDFTVGLFREMLNSMQVACFKKNIEKMSKEMPILLLSGGDDPVGNFGKGVIKTYNKFKQAKIASVDMKIYPGMRHDILHEAKYLEVYNDIVDFINTKIVK